MMVQESTSRPVWGDGVWLSCHRKISGLDSSKDESQTSSSFSSTKRQRSTRRALGWEELVAARKRPIPRAQSVKEVMPREATWTNQRERERETDKLVTLADVFSRGSSLSSQNT